VVKAFDKFTCHYQKLFRSSHQAATRKEAPLACSVVRYGTCCGLKRGTPRSSMAHAARHTSAVLTTLGLSASTGAMWHGNWTFGGLRSGARTRARRSGVQTRGTDAGALSKVYDTASHRVDRCPPLVVQEDGHHGRACITLTDEAWRRRASSL
jgi:hypothetical protein